MADRALLGIAFSDGVLVALITVGLGGLLTIFNSVLSRHASRAKDEVGLSVDQVGVANKAMEGMERLANQLRADNDALRAEHDRQATRIDELEHDLLEERSTNVALGRLLEQLRRERGPDPIA